MPCKIFCIPRTWTFNQYFKYSSFISLENWLLYRFLKFNQYLQSLRFFRVGKFFRKRRRRSSRAFRVLKCIQTIVSDCLDQLQSVFEMLLCFPWETDNYISRKRDSLSGASNIADPRQVTFDSVTASHCFQYAIRARLDGQVHPVTEVFEFVDRIYDVGMKVSWE